MTELDARGLKCPLPVLRARKLLKSMNVGDELMIIATDPAAPRDFAAFCAEAGHDLLSSTEEAGGSRILLRRGGG